MDMKNIRISNRDIGPDQPCFIIAEAGVNHDGELSKALELVDAAAKTGADAVKFQTFESSELVSTNAPKAAYQLDLKDADESQAQMLSRLQLTADDFRALQARCVETGIQFLSTPFEQRSAELLMSLDVPMFKMPSGEITNLALLGHVAAYGRPMIISTGMATMEEVSAAVNTIRQAGDPAIVLLHCVSAYPAAPKDANLRAMATLSEAFDVPVGFSDHTLGIEVAIAAAALGACVIEKHFTLDTSSPGPDHKASLEPDEFAAMVSGIRIAQVALGDGKKQPRDAEAEISAVARKSLVAACDIAAGEIIEPAMISIKRPGNGIAPARLADMIGRKVRRLISAGTLLSEDMLD
jgi:N,N'-diacetyllegionaminate synthase